MGAVLESGGYVGGMSAEEGAVRVDVMVLDVNGAIAEDMAMSHSEAVSGMMGGLETEVCETMAVVLATAFVNASGIANVKNVVSRA